MKRAMGFVFILLIILSHLLSLHCDKNPVRGQEDDMSSETVGQDSLPRLDTWEMTRIFYDYSRNDDDILGHVILVDVPGYAIFHLQMSWVPLENYHRTYAFAIVHQVKSPVDIFETHGMGDHIVDIDFAIHVIIHVAWKFATATNATKGSATPDSTRDQLKWPRTDFLAGSCHTDDD